LIGLDAMGQTRLFLAANAAGAKAITRMLEAEFEEDGVPVASFETDGATGSWEISVYCDADEEAQFSDRIGKALAGTGNPVEIGREPLGDVDWIATTLAGLKPVRSGRFIVHGSHDRHVPKPHEHAILVDAGQAFGTGHHGTTAGCLDMLGLVLKRRRFRSVLDLGTGSGVLAIAAARAMPVKVLASDIDSISTAVARENARLNQVAGRIDCITAKGFGHQKFRERAPFDLILANILARPLELLARDLSAHLSRPGTVILSGLLPHQKARIVSAYRSQGLRLSQVHLREGWLTLVMEKG
jgi:ribosomal protein L11 methyltransferase